MDDEIINEYRNIAKKSGTPYRIDGDCIKLWEYGDPKTDENATTYPMDELNYNRFLEFCACCGEHGL